MIKDKNEPPKEYQIQGRPHMLIVESRYYVDVADMLMTGAKKVLDRVNATCDVLTVPGAFEIPTGILYSVKALNFDATRRRYDGYVALGCIVKGETIHDQIIGFETARSLQQLSLEYALAIGNSILTVNTHEQALVRANPEQGDHGGAAAEACLRMIEIKQQYNLSPKRRWVAGRP